LCNIALAKRTIVRRFGIFVESDNHPSIEETENLMKTFKLFASVLIMVMAFSTGLWAQTSSTPVAPSHEQIKREAELQKKAAEAKQKWAKAEEKVKKLEQELEKAKQEALRTRQEADKAQQQRDAVKTPPTK
jgi:uncharacterized protein HemX